jgi:hypothetical protein
MMQTQCAKVQIVEVINEHRLLDADQCEWRYWRRDGKPLPAGYYLVQLPQRAAHARFHEDADFRGPFRQRDAAQAALEQLRASLQPEPSRAMR